MSYQSNSRENNINIKQKNKEKKHDVAGNFLLSNAVPYLFTFTKIISSN